MSIATRIALALAATLTLGFGADVAGNWKMTADAPDGNTYHFTLTVKGSGSELSASMASPEAGNAVLKDVAFKDNQLTFKLAHEVGLIEFKLKLDGDSLKGTLATPQGDTGDVSGSREATSSAALTGKWNIVAKGANGEDIKATLDVTEAAGKLSGDISTDQGTAPISDGKVSGSQVEFKIPAPEGTWTVTGTVDGTRIKGNYKTPDGASGTFTATK